MGQLHHSCARTTEANRQCIQNRQASLAKLAQQSALNLKTVAKWKKQNFAHDTQMGPKERRSTVLSLEEEARKHTLLPLDDCLYALQTTIPHLTRSALHRCLQRHGIS